MRKNIIILSLGLFGLASCKKYLGQTPDNRASLTTPTQVSQLLGTAYPQGSYMAFCESMSDNMDDKSIGTIWNDNRDPFFFDDVRDDQSDSPEFYWNACYTAIASANLALQTCTSAADTNAYSAQKGEALVARAYAHFMLVTFFSKVYDPTTAATDPGIPYETTPETKVFGNTYDRKTVQYVYDMVEKDLLQGLPLIQDANYTVPHYHFTKAAANAFAARFYLFKQDYAKVITYANNALPASNFTDFLRPWNTVYKGLTYKDLFARYERASENANLLLAEAPSLWGRYFYTTRYGMGAHTKNVVINNSPVTGGTWAFYYQLYSTSDQNYLIPKINEFFVANSINADIGTPYVMCPLFTTEEVLFNRAEANVYLNNTNAAISDLNAYASTRIVDYDPSANAITATKLKNYYGTSNLQTNLINAILDFKRAEYIQEGMRYLDILRYNIPVTHVTSDGQTMTLTGTDLRRTFVIPEAAVTAGLAQNPR